MNKIIKTLAMLCVAMSVQAQQQINMPIIQTKFTADPAPLVHNDTIYLYTGHDEDNAESFYMKDWLLYTSTDMVNWQDRGAVASLRDFKWFHGDNGAWAMQVVERNGKFYMYCTADGISILESDSPYGPFKDPLGKRLIKQPNIGDDIDPTVFVDDDGQAYMYWGNPNTYYVKLNDDMISYTGDIVKLPRIEDYQEGPWVYKRNGNYYMAFASTCCPEGIGYAMSKSPVGPWEYKGHIMDHTPRTRGNHPGIIDYKGKTYCFGQTWDIFRLETNRHAERRSISVAEMEYNADGTIKQLPYFIDCKLEQIEPFNPYRRVEAETMAWGYGLKTIPKNQWMREHWHKVNSDHTNQLVTDIDDGEYILLKGVDLKKGAKEFIVSASCLLYGGTIEVRIDDYNGPCIGSVNVGCTQDKFKEVITKIKGAKGVHDLYLVFKGDHRQKKNLFVLDWWEMR